MTSFVLNLKETKLAKEKENTLSMRAVRLAQNAKVFWRTPACSREIQEEKPQSRVSRQREHRNKDTPPFGYGTNLKTGKTFDKDEVQTNLLALLGQEKSRRPECLSRFSREYRERIVLSKGAVSFPSETDSNQSTTDS